VRLHTQRAAEVVAVGTIVYPLLQVQVVLVLTAIEAGQSVEAIQVN